MEGGKGVDVIYTDFSKAFDKCETGVLLRKLKAFGVSGKVGCWLAAFLDSSVRKQAVGVDGVLSALAAVISGMPQGTVLGPYLFLIQLADIDTSLSEGTEASSFADDTRVRRGIASEEDCAELQKDLQGLYDWADTVGMVFNSEKFELLRFWADDDKKPDFVYTGPNGNPIEEKSSLRDLGVRISSDLSFSEQIEKVAKEGEQMASWVLRTFRGRGKILMLTVLRSLIQSRLDYCSQLWSPRDQSSINRIESVQRHFLSKMRCAEVDGLNYWENLEHLKVYLQERRRERYQICLLWKASQGLTEGVPVKFHWSDRRGRYAVPAAIPRNAPTKVKKARERMINVHGTKLFNILPKSLRNEDSGDFLLFKNHLDIFLSQIPDQPTVAGLGRAAQTNSLIDQVPLATDIVLD